MYDASFLGLLVRHYESGMTHRGMEVGRWGDIEVRYYACGGGEISRYGRSMDVCQTRIYTCNKFTGDQVKYTHTHIYIYIQIGVGATLELVGV